VPSRYKSLEVDRWDTVPAFRKLTVKWGSHSFIHVFIFVWESVRAWAHRQGWEGRSRHIHLLFERWKFVPSVRVHAHLKNSTHKRAKHFIKINNRSTLIWQFNELTVLSPKLRSCWYLRNLTKELPSSFWTLVSFFLNFIFLLIINPDFKIY